MKTNSQLIAEVLAELESARNNFPGEEDVLSDHEWLAIVTEEIGEAAHELTRLLDPEKTLDRARLADEVVQVAAMAARWLSTLPATTLFIEEELEETFLTYEGGL